MASSAAEMFITGHETWKSSGWLESGKSTFGAQLLHKVGPAAGRMSPDAPVEGIGEGEEGDVGPQQVSGNGLDLVVLPRQQDCRHQCGCGADMFIVRICKPCGFNNCCASPRGGVQLTPETVMLHCYAIFLAHRQGGLGPHQRSQSGPAQCSSG